MGETTTPAFLDPLTRISTGCPLRMIQDYLSNLAVASTSYKMESSVPKYKDLPQPVAGFHCSWSYFNSLCQGDDQKDQLGTVSDPLDLEKFVVGTRLTIS